MHVLTPSIPRCLSSIKQIDCFPPVSWSPQMSPCPSHQFSRFLVCGGYRIVDVKSVHTSYRYCNVMIPRLLTSLWRATLGTLMKKLTAIFFHPSIHTSNFSCRASRWVPLSRQLWGVQPQHPQWPLTGPLTPESLFGGNTHMQTHCCGTRKSLSTPQTQPLQTLRAEFQPSFTSWRSLSLHVALAGAAWLWNGGHGLVVMRCWRRVTEQGRWYETLRDDTF